jgi:hypothetical protein
MALHVTTERGGEFRVQSDDMGLAGDILQDWFSYISVENMSSIANFPVEMEAFKKVLEEVEEYNRIRSRLCADMADSSNVVKELAVRAEDARMLGGQAIPLHHVSISERVSSANRNGPHDRGLLGVV